MAVCKGGFSVVDVWCGGVFVCGWHGVGGMVVSGGGVVFSVLCGLVVGSGAKIKIMRIIA